ncbi:MAG: hypothetical protein WCL32_02805 [Planctomycetota bacterium]
MSCHDESLLRRLDELEARVKTFDRSRRFPGWFAALVCGFLGGWLGQYVTDPASVRAQPDAGHVTAKSLKIVDDQGKVVVLLAADKIGGSARVFTNAGNMLVAVEGDPDGGMVRINGHDGLERAFLGVGDRKGGGLLYLRGADGKNHPVSLGVGNKGGYMALNNLALNKRSVWLGSDDSEIGGAAFVYDRQGYVRADIGCNPQGGMINIYGSKKGKSQIFLGTGSLDLGGLMLLRNDDGKIRAEIGQGSNGGYITLNGNKDDRPHVALATSDDQRGGYVQIRDNKGAIKAELGIDKDGVGYVDSPRP